MSAHHTCNHHQIVHANNEDLILRRKIASDPLISCDPGGLQLASTTEMGTDSRQRMRDKACVIY
jgi:hypothetical protein